MKTNTNRKSKNTNSINLLVVESPTKIRTIKKYLDKDFELLASYGHVRDLVPKSGSVDTEHDFAMKYEPLKKNMRHLNDIAKMAKKAKALYLATDPDREGEAIAWHICELLKEQKLLNNLPVYRVVFHEITKSAIVEAIHNPRELSMELVNAQQARRALDYLVGFNLSPLLWKKIRFGLSAGRVQSPALRMIVEREEAIEAFKSEEYWTIESDLDFNSHNFAAKLFIYHNEKLHQFSVTDSTQANLIKQELNDISKGKLIVVSVEKKQRKRNPAPPFITATLQQEAARKLGFSASNTMRVAQQLYEGVDTGEGEVGLITYMRTDSTNLANEAIVEIRDFITKTYGANNLPDEARVYKTKSKSAQEAHEAIRPTSVNRRPEDLANFLSSEQLRLYSLIWKRTVACQMLHATIDTVTADLSCGAGNIFRATGSRIAVPGFITVYQEGVDDASNLDGDDKLLPLFKVGEEVSLLQIRGEQHFTEPPPRYSEASLIKALEEYGIGRPSTYASIISTLQDREYVILDNKRFKPTDVGRVVNRFLTNYFTQYVDYGFTANLEDKLDEIARGENYMLPLLNEFWKPFKSLLDDVQEKVKRKDVTQTVLDEACPKCGKPLSVRLGKTGSFVGCTGYPECNYTRSYEHKEGEGDAEFKLEPEIIPDRTCPLCGSQLQMRFGRYGKFIGCTKYPECKYIEPLDKPQDTNVKCPVCNKSNMLKRKSRFGKIFYSCGDYPTCKYAVWYEPIAEACPKCGWPILIKKVTKRHGEQKACPQKGCGYVAE